MIRRGRRLELDKFTIEQRLAAEVHRAWKENGRKLGAARRAVAEYYGTSEDTVKRAWRTWGTGEQAPQNRGRAFSIELMMRISPHNYAQMRDELRTRLAEIRASRGRIAARR